MEQINWQLSSMTLLFLTGVFWGFLYNIFRLAGYGRKDKNFLDLVFWIISFLLIVPLIYFANWLELRFYVWFSIAAGFLAYRLIFFRPVNAVLRLLFRR